MWPLARMLWAHDRFRLVVAVAGISVSVVLVLVQIGLYFGFMQNASSLVDHAQARIWVVGDAFETIDRAPPIDERTFYRVLGTPGVARAERMVLEWGTFRARNGGVQSVEVIGLERAPQLMAPWSLVAGDVRSIGEPDGVIVDRTEYPKLLIDRIGDTAEIGGTRARVVGLTDGIHSFSTSPYVFTDLANARAYTRAPPDQIEFVLVEPASGLDPDALVARLDRIPYVRAFSSRAMSDRAQSYWATRTGIAAGLFTTAVLGVVVGFVIVAQILYTSTLDHLVEYGTLKAMGATNGRVAGVILIQAILSAGSGIVIGTMLAFAARSGMRTANLSVVLSPSLIGGTALLTVATCSIASLLSITKVFRLEPASVFKG